MISNIQQEIETLSVYSRFSAFSEFPLLIETRKNEHASMHAHNHVHTRSRAHKEADHSHNARNLQSVNELPLRNLIIKQSSKASARRDNSRLSLTVAL